MSKMPTTSPRKKIVIPHWIEFAVGIFGTVLLLGGLGYWAWSAFGGAAPTAGVSGSPELPTDTAPISPYENLPGSDSALLLIGGLQRTVDFHTIIPNRSPDWVIPYIIQKGDTVNAIANQFGLKPASLVWGNPEALAQDANMLRPGQSINILPVDGAFYQWKKDDTLKQVADDWNTTIDAIVGWPGNHINPLDPIIYPVQWVILPGGIKPFEWEAARIRNGKSSTFALGSGACLQGYDGPSGDTDFVWPTTSHYLSGTDYMPPAHPGIDIAIYLGQPIFAADNGVIVYAGWSQNRDGTPGYGNLVIIDHLNGYHSFYAHLLQINVHCGQPVYKGTGIGLGGSSGNSTGPHLHFEIRSGGYPINPWDVLPAT
jgi:murein DD-endopeptidase MepM/ murein hydrolase activator NlpD